MKHELGHLQLGSDSHSSTEIMRATWNAANMRHTAKGDLLFTSRQTRVMQGNAFARSFRPESPQDSRPIPSQ